MDIHEVHKMKDEQQMEASTSPSHEFSFSVSLQTSTTDKTKAPPSPSLITLDLSPADDIFFHGHLLPLHLPVPPRRSSTNSMETTYNSLPITDNIINPNTNGDTTRDQKPKSKSFSLLGLRWRKGYEATEQDTKVKQQFNFRHVLKRYARMVRPFLPFGGRRNDMKIHRQSYSFSGNSSFRKKPDQFRGIRRGGFSAPVSMRTSPTNSGVLLPTTTTSFNPSTNDSTMEELQAAIQAAIAHCKNSVLKEERLKC